ncbi:laccase [Heterobasidion irregulare TC 32-1]|uniref:Laccase n=1 Tax=Heterobasidion irregulare (strain TC 32-1) TaxID=747525 RepID=W4KIT5_HETIT|nr:laccase [Heterobasidion irregulare TC 32-1]ETW84966.1 laccase [Heterobasidion irregulare TC 32-1]
MFRLQRFVVLASLLASGALALSSQGPTAPLQIVNKEIAPDGYQRNTVLANGEYPAPLIKATKASHRSFEDIRDAMKNSIIPGRPFPNQRDQLTDRLHRNGDGYLDSLARSISTWDQLGRWRFLRHPGQAGTWWYHSHLSAQYCDGLRGPLVIYDPKDPHADLYDVDDGLPSILLRERFTELFYGTLDTTVITLGDWYHYLSKDAPPAPQASSILINGLGRYKMGPTGADAPLAVVGVEQGKRYRFRLVSISCDVGVDFSIDQHKMTIIEADGSNTEPLDVDSVTILTGQRYSVVVAANQPVDNYWIRAQPASTAIQGFDGGRNSAILRYRGAPSTDPNTTFVDATSPMVETNLHALDNPSAPGQHVPGGADINYTLDVSFSGGSFTVNGTSFEAPSVPVLLQIMSGAKQPSDLLPKGSIYGLEPNKSVELVIPGGVLGGPHPVHLHGHSFSVVRSAGSDSYNWDNPVRRDVVSIGSQDTDRTTIRFFTDNTGPWFLHCHIDWHLTAGFAVVFAEDVADTASVSPTPAHFVTDSWNDLCPAYNAAENKAKTNTAPKKLTLS